MASRTRSLLGPRSATSLHIRVRCFLLHAITALIVPFDIHHLLVLELREIKPRAHSRFIQNIPGDAIPLVLVAEKTPRGTGGEMCRTME